MYRHAIPLSRLSLGQNPQVDLHILGDYLSFWYEEEASSRYSSGDTDALRELMLIARALAATVDVSKDHVNPGAYQQCFADMRDMADIQYTESALARAAKDSQ